MHASPIPPGMLADLDQLRTGQLETLTFFLRGQGGGRLNADQAELLTAVAILQAERADPIRGPVRAAVRAAYADAAEPAACRPAWYGLYRLLEQTPEADHAEARALYDAAYGCTLTRSADGAADLLARTRRRTATRQEHRQ